MLGSKKHWKTRMIQPRAPCTRAGRSCYRLSGAVHGPNGVWIPDTAVDGKLEDGAHSVFLKDVLPKEEYKLVEKETKKAKMKEKLKVSFKIRVQRKLETRQRTVAGRKAVLEGF